MTSSSSRALLAAGLARDLLPACYCGRPSAAATSPRSPPFSLARPENAHILDGTSQDLQAQCDQYEAKILAYGGIELFMAGIGPDGHIAFSAS